VVVVDNRKDQTTLAALVTLLLLLLHKVIQVAQHLRMVIQVAVEVA
jgi:hypothetical protein